MTINRTKLAALEGVAESDLDAAPMTDEQKARAIQMYRGGAALAAIAMALGAPLEDVREIVDGEKPAKAMPAPVESAMARAEREYNEERERSRLAGRDMAPWEQSNARRALLGPAGVRVVGDGAIIDSRDTSRVGL